MNSRGDAELIEIYFDYRSPYAYFLWSDVAEAARDGQLFDWRPVSIGVLLNLQRGRDPWAVYEDPLPTVKRQYVYEDVARGAEYRGLPLRAPKPFRPDPLLALQTNLVLEESAGLPEFRDRIFRAVWEEQRDVSSKRVLVSLLEGLVGDPSDVVESACADEQSAELERRTCEAFDRGIFGVPTMCWGREIFFGSDRWPVLEWRLRTRSCGGAMDGDTRS